MNWNDFETAFKEARQIVKLADSHIRSMAYMVEGRLRSAEVPSDTLIKLKKELANYNMHTRTWNK